MPSGEASTCSKMCGLPTGVTATAASGVATFTGLSITKADVGYQVSASGNFFGTNVTTAGGLFNVGPATASSLVIVAGNNQTALAGSTLPVNPTVGVSDTYGNPVPGASITWAAGGSSDGVASPTSSTTGTNGQASTSWTIGAGYNALLATLVGASTVAPVRFEATGTTPTLVSLDACLPGGSGDAFAQTASPYAFYIPGPKNNQTFKQIQLYISSAGKANSPSAYTLQLSI